MKTLTETILDHFEMSREDGDRSVKAVVISEDDRARCVKTAKGFSIRSGAICLGFGPTENSAWENAALRILLIKP